MLAAAWLCATPFVRKVLYELVEAEDSSGGRYRLRRLEFLQYAAVLVENQSRKEDEVFVARG